MPAWIEHEFHIDIVSIVLILISAYFIFMRSAFSLHLLLDIYKIHEINSILTI